MIRLFLLANLLIGALAVNAQHSIELRQTEKQRLDSSITEYYDHESMSWYYVSKNEYIYDSNQRVTLNVRYGRDTIDNSWIKRSRTEYIYDEQGNQISVSEYKWIADSGHWADDYDNRLIQSYDENGNMTQEIYERWDIQFGETTNLTWYQYDYDDEGRLISTELRLWSQDYEIWYNHWKHETIYDTEGNIIQELIYAPTYDSNTSEFGWRNDHKTEYTYFPDNTKLSEEYEWESATEQWIASDFHEETCDNNDNLVEKISYRQDSINQSVPYASEEYFYDNNDNLTKKIAYQKDSTNQWVPDTDREYLYDDYNNRTVGITQFKWDSETEQWTSLFRYEYSYDNNYTYDDLILPDVDPYIFRHKHDEYMLYLKNEDMPELTPCVRKTYYYSLFVLTSNEHTVYNPIRIFPNPAKDMITFDLQNSTSADIKLYDAQGKYISTQNLQNNQLPVNQLNSGVYFYELFYEGEMFGGKFIVK